MGRHTAHCAGFGGLGGTAVLLLKTRTRPATLAHPPTWRGAPHNLALVVHKGVDGKVLVALAMGGARHRRHHGAGHRGLALCRVEEVGGEV